MKSLLSLTRFGCLLGLLSVLSPVLHAGTTYVYQVDASLTVDSGDLPRHLGNKRLINLAFGQPVLEKVPKERTLGLLWDGSTLNATLVVYNNTTAAVDTILAVFSNSGVVTNGKFVTVNSLEHYDVSHLGDFANIRVRLSPSTVPVPVSLSLTGKVMLATGNGVVPLNVRKGSLRIVGQGPRFTAVDDFDNGGSNVTITGGFSVGTISNDGNSGSFDTLVLTNSSNTISSGWQFFYYPQSVGNLDGLTPGTLTICTNVVSESAVAQIIGSIPAGTTIVFEDCPSNTAP